MTDKEHYILRINNIIARNKAVGLSEVEQPGYKIENDSLTRLELSIEVEDEFSIEIPEYEPKAWNTAEDIYRTVLQCSEGE